MRRFLGVDVGGTNTRALVADEAGGVLGVGRAGTGNWEGVGLEGTYQALDGAVGAALAQAGVGGDEIAAAGYGLGGLDWPSDETRLAPVIARLGVAGDQVLVNDAFVALRTGASWGVAIVAGTGFTVAGRNRAGKTARSFGLGPPYDEWGSAPELAWQGVRAVARAHSEHGPETVLSRRLVDLIGARDVADLLEGLSRERYALEPSTAEVVQAMFAAAEGGDGPTLEVIECGASHLAESALVVARRLGMAAEPFNLVLSGGLFRASSSLLIDALWERVRAGVPGARLVRLEAPPVVGGVLLAMEAAGLAPSPEVCRRLKEEARDTFPANRKS